MIGSRGLAWRRRMWMAPSTRLLGFSCAIGLLPGCAGLETADGVETCDNVTDCSAQSSSQWDVECVFADGQDPSTPKVCSPVFREVRCGPDTHIALQDKWDEALAVDGVYVGCAPDQMGARGCGPNPVGEACDDGLIVNSLGACDQPGAKYLAAGANGDRAGLDVLDQFCRNYFCSEEWMCDASGGVPICRPCRTVGEDGAPGVGQGACAEVWVKNSDGTASVSSVYDVGAYCEDENGLSSDPNTALRLAAEMVGEVPSND